MMKSSRLYHMVLAGVLCAVGIVVPMFMPRIVLGPMSFTLASHVAVFLGMFISPAVAVAVCIGTTLGFFLTTPAIILSGALFTPEQLANGFVTSVVLLVGLGTLVHSMLDYSISILIWKPVSLAVPRSTKA